MLIGPQLWQSDTAERRTVMLHVTRFLFVARQAIGRAVRLLLLSDYCGGAVLLNCRWVVSIVARSFSCLLHVGPASANSLTCFLGSIVVIVAAEWGCKRASGGDCLSYLLPSWPGLLLQAAIVLPPRSLCARNSRYLRM
eukprot:INCI5018.10.p1 GENE.INCI5018.10~~INCI5018.10.p1  ORF type:complete len:139 (+),score=14.07 INCI5018.10:250-666(+)